MIGTQQFVSYLVQYQGINSGQRGGAGARTKGPPNHKDGHGTLAVGESLAMQGTTCRAVETQIPGPSHPGSLGLRWGPRICNFNKPLAHVAPSCLWTIL